MKHEPLEPGLVAKLLLILAGAVGYLLAWGGVVWVVYDALKYD